MRKGLIVLVCLSFFVPAAQAWGPRQHKAVALIAQQRLSAKALKEVQALLGKGIGLDKISSCADAMLHTNVTFDCGGAFPVDADTAKATAPWHFIDIPIKETVTADTLMDYCPNRVDCVVAQIRRQAEVLGDATASRRQKQLALMFLVHFVGDEHQPLHGADDDDRGGNKKNTVFLGARKNLHSLWDDMILAEDWREQDGMDPAPLVSELEADIKKRNTGRWTEGNFISEAALESFKASKDIIYPQYAKDKGRNLGIPYQQKMQPIAKQRIEMAGLRLAAILNGTFSGGQSYTTQP